MKSTKYVIVGGGMVAGYAAKELVNRGLKSGELAIISSENALPYERPPLSKGFLAGKDTEATILINGMEFYHDHGIHVKLGMAIKSVDPKRKRVKTHSGEDFAFDSLLLATGARARSMDCPGRELRDVFYFALSRGLQEPPSECCNRQGGCCYGGRVHRDGSGSCARPEEHSDHNDYPGGPSVESILHPGDVDVLRSLLLYPRSAACKASQHRGLGGKGMVHSVLLVDGRRIPSDLVVAGIGAIPNTDLLAKSGLFLSRAPLIHYTHSLIPAKITTARKP